MKNKGFTLLELMVVVAVAAIVAAIGFPTFMAQRDRARIKRAGRDIVSHFQMARINAMRDGKIWAIVFDAEQEKYTLVHAGDDGVLDTGDDVTVQEIRLADYGDVSFGIGSIVAQNENDLQARPGADTAPADGISFNGGRVQFKPDGTSSLSGTVYVVNTRGQTLAVGSISRTGRVKVWADYGQGWES